jgi:hypothetical protein
MNNYRVTVEYKDGFIDKTEFMVLKFALKWMHYVHSHFTNIIAVKLEVL